MDAPCMEDQRILVFIFEHSFLTLVGLNANLLCNVDHQQLCVRRKISWATWVLLLVAIRLMGSQNLHWRFNGRWAYHIFALCVQYLHFHNPRGNSRSPSHYYCQHWPRCADCWCSRTADHFRSCCCRRWRWYSKMYKNGSWFKITFLCQCILVTAFRKWDLRKEDQELPGSRAGQRRASESTDNRSGGHTVYSILCPLKAHQKDLLILPMCQTIHAFFFTLYFLTTEKFDNNKKL